MLRTIGAGMLGAAAFGTVGYFIGPEIGFGRVQGCVLEDLTTGCSTGEPIYTPEELAARQKTADQKRGV
ncbi:MAG: hypothetical protein GWN71_40950, partial [Gammaproteobacteria bacterium]|nr:hypothetical protein [Gemmatimonadota bacterium]NIT68769.1 hypothetical protein [Gemmatimonadota bacterium]NIU79685.1 hypothetical protein [Gammaproteobacteria bacterium]NIW77487.1 hypothetical protein [Gemmatimonadota bacterium]NIY37346.1 hypothetical protein [Gemmatimonadota bacterium]